MAPMARRTPGRRSRRSGRPCAARAAAVAARPSRAPGRRSAAGTAGRAAAACPAAARPYARTDRHCPHGRSCPCQCGSLTPQSASPWAVGSVGAPVSWPHRCRFVPVACRFASAPCSCMAPRAAPPCRGTPPWRPGLVLVRRLAPAAGRRPSLRAPGLVVACRLVPAAGRRLRSAPPAWPGSAPFGDRLRLERNCVLEGGSRLGSHVVTGCSRLIGCLVVGLASRPVIGPRRLAAGALPFSPSAGRCLTSYTVINWLDNADDGGQMVIRRNGDRNTPGRERDQYGQDQPTQREPDDYRHLTHRRATCCTGTVVRIDPHRALPPTPPKDQDDSWARHATASCRVCCSEGLMKIVRSASEH